MNVHVIRHGETDWSRAGRHTGLTDLPLTADGEAQARHLAPWFAATRFTLVLSSPLLRARQTCAGSGLSPQQSIDPDLAEWDYGDYEGLRSADIAQTRAGDIAQTRAGDIAQTRAGDIARTRAGDITRTRAGWNVFADGCPGGETPAQVGLRADRVIAICGATQGNIAVFTHGEFASVLAVRWIGLPVAAGAHFCLGPAAVAILGSRPGHPDIAAILLWNVRPGSLPQAGW